MITAPANSVLRATEEDASVGLLLLQGSSRILQTETMIETLTHRDMSSRLVSFNVYVETLELQVKKALQ